MTYICAHANLYIHLNPPLSWIPWENDLFDVMYAEKINSVWNTLISVIIFDVEGIVFLYKLHPPLTAYNGHARVQTYIYWWEMLLQIHLCVNNDLMWRNYSFLLIKWNCFISEDYLLSNIQFAQWNITGSVESNYFKSSPLGDDILNLMCKRMALMTYPFKCDICFKQFNSWKQYFENWLLFNYLILKTELLNCNQRSDEFWTLIGNDSCQISILNWPSMLKGIV